MEDPKELARIKGSFEWLWDTFGGTVNEKGYKVLNPKVGLIYGDSITLERQEEILDKLEIKGFTADNLVLGIGSFTYQHNTRDTFGFAVKATSVVINGERKAIFKDPVTDDGTKKSHYGRVRVHLVKDGFGDKTLVVKDEKDIIEKNTRVIYEDQLKTVFNDGNLINEISFEDIKKKLKVNCGSKK